MPPLPPFENLLMQRVSLPGHFQGQVQIESVRPLGDGFGIQVRRSDGSVFAYPLHGELDGQGSLSQGSHALVEKKGGECRLRDFTARDHDESLGLPRHGRPAPLVNVLHCVLRLVEQQPAAIPKNLDDAGADINELRVAAQGAGRGGQRERHWARPRRRAWGGGRWAGQAHGELAHADRGISLGEGVTTRLVPMQDDEVLL